MDINLYYKILNVFQLSSHQLIERYLTDPENSRQFPDVIEFLVSQRRLTVGLWVSRWGPRVLFEYFRELRLRGCHKDCGTLYAIVMRTDITFG
ncbi:hypothetical protein WN51_08678 [Melipona quadrifasciata]|uniref:Uncharacterized protein n=1 Tax=Melipona quadrifasciata TaxID=166423 RepID=A0A0M9AA16_9HYME|nr:hypothetical protein WN51_08678 [Melipona quadrifasciata]